MTAVTFSLALLGALLAWRVRPALALCVYCAGLFLYPQDLTLPIGRADFSLSRILIVVVLGNAILGAKLQSSFRWAWIDTLVCVAYLLAFAALLYTFPAIALERHGGKFFDTLLPYFAVRLIVTDEEACATLVKSLTLMALPLVVFAVYEMVSSNNVVALLTGSNSWQHGAHQHYLRLGMHRAAVTFAHPIAFGMFCSMVAPLGLSLWGSRGWPDAWLVALILVSCLGVFASLSAGPLLSLVFSGLVFVAYWNWRPVVGFALTAVILLAGVGWYTDRQYVDLLASLTFDARNAIYRVGLIREALDGGMSGHWLTGYGYVGVGPGTDNTNFHWQHPDIVNLYLQHLVRTGLLGLTPYLLVNALYYLHLFKAFSSATTSAAGWLPLCVFAAMLGWNAAMMTVGALSQTQQLLYIGIALSANMPLIVSKMQPSDDGFEARHVA